MMGLHVIANELCKLCRAHISNSGMRRCVSKGSVEPPRVIKARTMTPHQAFQRSTLGIASLVGIPFWDCPSQRSSEVWPSNGAISSDMNASSGPKIIRSLQIAATGTFGQKRVLILVPGHAVPFTTWRKPEHKT